MIKVTVNGSVASGHDPEFHPSILDPRFTRTQENSPTKRNIIKGRPLTAANARRLTRTQTPTRNEKGQFVKRPKRLTQNEINRRGKYGY